MGVSDRAQDTDWLELCRRATDALRRILADGADARPSGCARSARAARAATAR